MPVQVKNVEFLLVNRKITNKEVQELLGVKDLRALKILKELVDNRLKCGGITRALL